MHATGINLCHRKFIHIYCVENKIFCHHMQICRFCPKYRDFMQSPLLNLCSHCSHVCSTRRDVGCLIHFGNILQASDKFTYKKLISQAKLWKSRNLQHIHINRVVQSTAYEDRLISEIQNEIGSCHVDQMIFRN